MQRVFIRKKQIVYEYTVYCNPNPLGCCSDKSSIRVDLDVYVSLTYTNGARRGDRREVLTLERRAVNIGRRGWGCFQEGRTFIQAVPLRVL